MLPFAVALHAGESPYRQIVYAATRAIVAGELRAGDAFPSVRELSHELKINPNTAQKVVAELTRSGLLEVRPGVGTTVARVEHPSPEEGRRLLAGEVERLVVEARRLGLSRVELAREVAQQWTALFGAADGAER